MFLWYLVLTMLDDTNIHMDKILVDLATWPFLCLQIVNYLLVGHAINAFSNVEIILYKKVTPDRVIHTANRFATLLLVNA